MRFFAAFAILIGLTALASAETKPTLVVLELTPSTARKGIDPQVVKLASALSVQLRARVAAAAHFALKKPDKTASDQMRLARECMSKLPACWASIGRELETDWMIYGTVDKRGDRFHVLVKLQEIKLKDKVKKAVFQAFDVSTTDELLPLLANELYLKLRDEPIPQTR